MDEDTISTIAVTVRGALEAQGYGVTFGHETEDEHRAFYVMDLASGRILAELVVRDPELLGSQPDDSAE
jgi:hypothetical protein